jgi:hypothetical protein
MTNEAIVEVLESPSEAYTPVESNLEAEDSVDLRPTIFAQPPSKDY